MRSTPEMRARIRELMTDPQDDYDRAVECVLDDIEVLEPMFDRAVTRGLEQVDRIATLEAALRPALVELLACSVQLKARKDGSIGRAIDLIRAALAPEQNK